MLIRTLSLFMVAMTGAAPAAAESVYFGNLHAHTSYSDGSGTPAEAYQMAREAGLDFYAITEHNHARAEAGAKERADGLLIATDPLLYSGRPTALRETADSLDDTDEFVTLYGQEFSTISSGNHMNVFGVPDVITVDNGAFDDLAEWAAGTPDTTGRPPVLQMNHPRNQREGPNDYGQHARNHRDDFASDAAWVAAMDPLVELIEVLNAPALRDGRDFRAHNSQSQYLRYLDLGFHVAPSTGHDNHYRNWGVSTDARVAVIADRLSRNDIMSALRSRHAYATEDKNLSIIYRANGALQGDIVPPPAAGSQLSPTVSIQDEDEPNARYRVEVLTDQPGDGIPAARVSSTTVPGDTSGPIALPPLPFRAAGQYVLLRITQTNAGGGSDRSWTAPVWFE